MMATPRWYLVSTVVLFVAVVGLVLYTVFLQNSFSSDIADLDDKLSASLATVDEKSSAADMQLSADLATVDEKLSASVTAVDVRLSAADKGLSADLTSVDQKLSTELALTADSLSNQLKVRADELIVDQGAGHS